VKSLELAFNLKFEDLYSREGLVKLDAIFLEQLKGSYPELHQILIDARAHKLNFTAKEYSNFITNLGPYVEDFISEVFKIKSEVGSLSNSHNQLEVIFRCKRLFVQRKAVKAVNKEQAKQLDIEEIAKQLSELIEHISDDFELNFATTVMKWLENEKEFSHELDVASKYASFATLTELGQKQHKNSVLFHTPKKLDFHNLVPVESNDSILQAPKELIKERKGFKLTDDGITVKDALDNAHYCIHCHNQEKDSCSKGFKEKDNSFKKNVFDIPLTGCPLEEKISEMNYLRTQGNVIAALATAMIDNPLLAATGHRICNDCMKSCIYQKQEPVNIPKVETETLDQTLSLPWGFEIYSLLTRWNPLNIKRPYPKPDSGYKVLVAGIGPAGFNLSHHLLNDGHIVVAIDGLKIEPLPEELSGVTVTGQKLPFKPIYDIKSLNEPLDNRIRYGFGGVAEYGITVRWDKNYLKIIRLLLERRQNFALYGGIRFGSNITYTQAFELGFNHIALAMGAGKPNLLSIPNSLVKGVRTASDFLMALQLTGADKANSISNLQIRLPVVVIGGGLTAIDTATESLAYYQVQVEKILKRYETLGEEGISKNWSEEDRITAQEFITHAKALRNAKSYLEKLDLINSWGGITICYRKSLTDAPSYRLNHEEVEHAIKEGIKFAENITPTGFDVDDFGHATSITTIDKKIPARTILIAAGTNPNITISLEDPNHFKLDGRYFTAVDEQGNKVTPERIAKPNIPYVLSSIDADKSVSFFGDLHPSFAGNVVKAMASAKQGYPAITNILAKSQPNSITAKEFRDKLNSLLIATVHDVVRLTDNIVEVIVKAPLAATNFKPGQFYRLQNFETLAIKNNDTTFAMEGLALTGASVDREKGLLSTIVLEMGGSSNLCAYLKKDEPVVLMGPTGTPTEIRPNENVMLIGGGLGNAVLFSIGKAFRDAGSKVLYFAGYKKLSDRYKIKEIEEAADYVVWACDEGLIEPSRSQDSSYHGNIIEAIKAYAENKLGPTNIELKSIDRIIAIGSDKMMEAVAIARHNSLKPYLNDTHEAIASINSPMQCMMKEICAQCLQKHVDPTTGLETYVYSCFNQDQLMDTVSFPHLNDRLKQNSLQEKMTASWIKHCLNK
jgi:NADPH-dependent glutamate synthase beta subunit-like oxidoreductase/NAD(P)H-flavin reductase